MELYRPSPPEMVTAETPGPAPVSDQNDAEESMEASVPSVHTEGQ